MHCVNNNQECQAWKGLQNKARIRLVNLKVQGASLGMTDSGPKYFHAQEELCGSG